MCASCDRCCLCRAPVQITVGQVEGEVEARLDEDIEIEEKVEGIVVTWDREVVAPITETLLLFTQPTTLELIKERPKLVASVNHYKAKLKTLEEASRPLSFFIVAAFPQLMGLIQPIENERTFKKKYVGVAPFLLTLRFTPFLLTLPRPLFSIFQNVTKAKVAEAKAKDKDKEKAQKEVGAAIAHLEGNQKKHDDENEKLEHVTKSLITTFHS